MFHDKKSKLICVIQRYTRYQGVKKKQGGFKKSCSLCEWDDNIVSSVK